MPGMPVTIGCAVILTPGAAGPPDTGVIIVVPQVVAAAGGMPLAAPPKSPSAVNLEAPLTILFTMT